MSCSHSKLKGCGENNKKVILVVSITSATLGVLLSRAEEREPCEADKWLSSETNHHFALAMPISFGVHGCHAPIRNYDIELPAGGSDVRARVAFPSLMENCQTRG